MMSPGFAKILWASDSHGYRKACQHVVNCVKMSVVHAAVRAIAITDVFEFSVFPVESTSCMSVETPSVSERAGERHSINKNGMIVIKLIVTARQMMSILVVLERKRDPENNVGRWCFSSANILSVPIANDGSKVERSWIQIICVNVNGIGIL